jgi:hypothetical protein
MKILQALATGVSLLFCLYSSAQTPAIPINEPDHNKPKLFSDLPLKMDLRVTDLEPVFGLAIGTEINQFLAAGFPFKGVVVSKSEGQDASLKSVVLRSSNRQGAVFTFTRRTGQDGTVVYLGRIISMHHGDAFEVALENGRYVLNKTALYDLFSE